MENKKLKIVFLSRYSGSVNRGVETYVLELSKRLKEDYEVEILSGKDADSLTKIIRGKYDIVISTNGRIQALKASLGRLFGGYKTVISGQSGIGRDDIWNIFISAPNIYVALTDHEMKWARKWAWRTRIVKIPNGVDLEKFSPLGLKADLDLQRPVVLSVGALYWYKYHERVIHAQAKLSSGSLLIIGSGPQDQYLQNLGNKLLGSSRFKIMKVDYNNLPEYYRAADVFTLPSWNREAFGIVYVEAMSCNLPVVAPDDLSRREIIGDAGVFVDVRDPAKYAEAIENAISKNWGNKPRSQAEKFSWDEIASKYEQLFKELLK